MKGNFQITINMRVKAPRGGTYMKIVTFNIRCDFGQDGGNNFCFRKPLILEKLRREAPDIICFQEVLPHVAG